MNTFGGYRNRKRPYGYNNMTETQEKEYKRKSARYTQITGKLFKRNGHEMYKGYTKLEAVSNRLRQLEGEIADKEAEEKGFEIGGAL